MSHREQLKAVYPTLGELLAQVPTLPDLEQQRMPVAEAVTKIVIGQMLSRAAADTIYERIAAARKHQGLEGSWQLSEAELLRCGLSRRKVRTIHEFGVSYECDPASIEAWRGLEYPELSAVVSGHWGLSQWSADMLAIFYFAKPDVFPETDGTITRVRRILEEEHLKGPLEPNLARPFRTSLTRHMWALLDTGVLKT